MCQLFENVKNGDSDASPCQNMREIGRQTDYWESNSFIMIINTQQISKHFKFRLIIYDFNIFIIITEFYTILKKMKL